MCNIEVFDLGQRSGTDFNLHLLVRETTSIN